MPQCAEPEASKTMSRSRNLPAALVTHHRVPQPTRFKTGTSVQLLEIECAIEVVSRNTFLMHLYLPNFPLRITFCGHKKLLQRL